MGSSSSSQQTQETSYTTETHNVSVQGNEGLALADANNNTVTVNTTTLDAGAIESAFDVTKNALSFAEKAGKNALDFAFNAGAPEAAMSKNQLYLFGGVTTLATVAYIASKKL